MNVAPSRSASMAVTLTAFTASLANITPALTRSRAVIVSCCSPSSRVAAFPLRGNNKSRGFRRSSMVNESCSTLPLFETCGSLHHSFLTEQSLKLWLEGGKNGSRINVSDFLLRGLRSFWWLAGQWGVRMRVGLSTGFGQLRRIHFGASLFFSRSRLTPPGIKRALGRRLA